MENIDKKIHKRLSIIYIVILLGFISVVGRILYLQIAEKEFWTEKSNQRYIQLQDVKARRGNIYSVDEETGEYLLLATDIPLYNAYIDLGYEVKKIHRSQETERVRVISDEYYNKHIEALCDSLAVVFKNSRNAKTKQEYMKYFANYRNRETANRYVLIQKDMSYEEYERFKKFPLVSREKKRSEIKKTIVDNEVVEERVWIGTGQYYISHFVHVEEKNIRHYPYGGMARRTIGTMVTLDGCDTCYNGLDGYYSNYLSGMHGKRLERKIIPGVWVPLEDKDMIKAVDGMDIVSTIDVRLQELAGHSLRKTLDSNNAESGCVVLMEVKTGKVRAISNLTRIRKGVYAENENIAATHLLEPGSTFKTITTMMMLDKGLTDTTQLLPTFEKRYPRASKPIKDVGIVNHGEVSLMRAMQMSSNVAMAQLVYDNYIVNDKREKLSEDLKEYFYFDRLNMDLELFEPKPFINEDALSVDDILRLGFGYVSMMTPIQLLAFYNAIANDGKLLKPIFASNLVREGRVVKSFEPIVINEKISSDSTIRNIQEILERVVLYGTARGLRSSDYGIAGKTGTAEIGYDSRENQLQHRASFVGYFPTDKPEYSCIVVISKPQKARTHGGDLAAPVFKELSDRIMGTKVFHAEYIENTEKVGPKTIKGNLEDYNRFCKSLGLDEDWEDNKTKDNTIVGNCLGMSARDAVYYLEKKGLKVVIKGRGKVVFQSLPSNYKYQKGDIIELKLSVI